MLFSFLQWKAAVLPCKVALFLQSVHSFSYRIDEHPAGYFSSVQTELLLEMSCVAHSESDLTFSKSLIANFPTYNVIPAFYPSMFAKRPVPLW